MCVYLTEADYHRAVKSYGNDAAHDAAIAALTPEIYMQACPEFGYDEPILRSRAELWTAGRWMLEVKCRARNARRSEASRKARERKYVESSYEYIAAAHKL